MHLWRKHLPLLAAGRTACLTTACAATYTELYVDEYACAYSIASYGKYARTDTSLMNQQLLAQASTVPDLEHIACQCLHDADSQAR